MTQEYRPVHNHCHKHEHHSHNHQHGPQNLPPHERVNCLEAVIVCVDYSDFLDITLQHNLHFFERVVVVSGFRDQRTKAVCDRHGIDCVRTDVFEEHGPSFNKALAINLGIAHLSGSGWINHLDADVILPDDYVNKLKQSALRRDCIYGADRMNIHGRKVYEELKQNKNFQRQHMYKYMVNTPNLPMGARVLHKEYGYCPIGYFQLWHASMGHRYPTQNQSTAEHTDVLFSLQWPRVKRVLLPNVITYHLESERAPMGANWNGRTTKPF